MKPILFNTQMVQAILDGRKTTTRRIIKNVEQFGTALATPKGIFSKKGLADHGPYKIGDILYVRETWLKADDDKYHYRADETPVSKEAREEFGYKWRPSIHMPKEASRIFLKVISVKVERLQDITEEGIRAEGITEEWPPFAQDKFQELWDSTLRKEQIEQYGFIADPWVWVIEFERCEKPNEG